MKSDHPKLKATPRPLFSCGLFRQCTQTVISPTASNSPTLPLSTSSDHVTLPLPPPPPPPSFDPPPQQQPVPAESESSSSSNTSQSFTQWRFSLPHSPISSVHMYPPSESYQVRDSITYPFQETRKYADPSPPPAVIITNYEELFHTAELQFSSGSESGRFGALHMMERSLVPNPPAVTDPCPVVVMKAVVGYLKTRAGGKPATKVLLALCLAENNRHVAVEVGAVGEIIEALAGMEAAVVERALAVLELLCTVEEGAAEVRDHALAVPMMVEVMGKMGGRGKEYAISVLGVIYGGSGELNGAAPPEEVARAVVLALQGDSTGRGKRKGAQLLKILEENGRLNLSEEG